MCTREPEEAALSVEYISSTDSAMLRGTQAKRYSSILMGKVQQATFPDDMANLLVDTPNRFEYHTYGDGMTLDASIDPAANVKFAPAVDLPAEWTIDTFVSFPLNDTVGPNIPHVLLETGNQQALLAISANNELGMWVPTDLGEKYQGIGVSDPANGKVFVAASQRLAPSRGWHQVSMTVTMRNIKFYLDGQQVGKVPFKEGIPEIKSLSTLGNVEAGGAAFNGAFGRVQIFFSAMDEFNGLNFIHAKPPHPFKYASANVYYQAKEFIKPNLPVLEFPKELASVLYFAPAESLPPGVMVHSSTGAIHGLPTASSSAMTYSVRAYGPNGYSQATVTMTILDDPPVKLSLAQRSAYYIMKKEMKPNLPHSNGGIVLRYSVSPPLPPGLSLDPEWGIVFGTPTTFSPKQAYTFTAMNSGGQTTFQAHVATGYDLRYNKKSFLWCVKIFCQFSACYSATRVFSNELSVGGGGGGARAPRARRRGRPPPPPPARPPSNNLHHHTNHHHVNAFYRYEDSAVRPELPVQPAANDHTSVFSKSNGLSPKFRVLQQLPPGVTFDKKTGAFAGTPSAEAPRKRYTVQGWVNKQVVAEVTVEIEVRPIKPQQITYSEKVFVFTKLESIKIPAPVVLGGRPKVFSVSPLSSFQMLGLTLNPKTGSIRGTLKHETSRYTSNFTIVAQNDGGKSKVQITIEVRNGIDLFDFMFTRMFMFERVCMYVSIYIYIHVCVCVKSFYSH
jgi:hypothetical protein